MGRASVPVAVAAALMASACVPRNATWGPPSLASRPATETAVTASAPAAELSPAERRVRELETQLAERDREIATVRQELAAAGAAAPASGGSAAPSTSNGTALSSDARAGAAAPATSAGAADAGSAGGPAPAPALAAAHAATVEARLDNARQQIASLQQRLDSEIARRKAVEAEMARLLEESSAGPYEQTAPVVEQHLRRELEAARAEITELRTTLTTERRQRGELERRFAALQAQMQRAGDAPGDNDEIAALKERQRRVLASIQQDLQASHQREAELRAALERTQGTGGVSLADEVTGLRTENAALQRRLDEEHRANRELAAKLKLAGRVTDLIFKMQSTGATAGAAPTAP